MPSNTTLVVPKVRII